MNMIRFWAKPETSVFYLKLLDDSFQRKDRFFHLQDGLFSTVVL